MDTLSIILALAVLVVIVGGIWNRISQRKGIGWQFIRYTVIGISLPIVALLAINDVLTEAAATIIASAMGYAFGKTGDPKAAKAKSKSAG